MFEKEPSGGKRPDDEEGPRPAPGEELPHLSVRREAVAVAAGLLGGLREVLWQGGTGELSGLMDDLGVLAARVDAARVAVAAEAQARGIVAESRSANTAQWVAAHSPHADGAGARRVARLAAAVQRPDNAPVTEALGVPPACGGVAGSVSTRCADVALREVEKVAPVVPDADRAEVLGWYLDVAETGGHRDMDRLTRWVLGRFAPDQLGTDAEKARRLSGIRISHLPGGLKRYVMELCAEHAAIVDAALEPLSAPQTRTHPDTGETILDTRLAPQRRAEALVEVFRRAQGGDDTTSVTGTTKVVVTMNLSDLVDQTGTGRTREGDLLDAGTVRRMACDAEVIPIVLGSESEPLDVGRQERLFAKGLRTAVVHRDRHCSFPGCDRPPSWTRVHHVKHWLDGGTTCLLNAALLCEKHHLIVHRDGLTATVTATGVTWHI